MNYQMEFQLSHARPYDLETKGSITAASPLWPTTCLTARYHLTWERIPTPFISVFGHYRKALDWAQILIKSS